MKKKGVIFRSAHKLRHGHAIYGIKNAKNIQELKAVSQNLMHSSISITVGIYGSLSGDDFINIITELGSSHHVETSKGQITSDLIQALIKLKEKPDLLKKILET